MFMGGMEERGTGTEKVYQSFDGYKVISHIRDKKKDLNKTNVATWAASANECVVFFLLL